MGKGPQVSDSHVRWTTSDTVAIPKYWQERHGSPDPVLGKPFVLRERERE